MVSFYWWTIVLVVSSSWWNSVSVTATTSSFSNTTTETTATSRRTTSTTSATSGRIQHHPHYEGQEVLHVVHVPNEDDSATAAATDDDDDGEDTTLLRVPTIITNSSFHVDHHRNMVVEDVRNAVPPYFVKWYGGLCGGSLIGPDLVLTSTQCYNIVYDNLGKVVIGGGKFTRKVIDVKPHFKYYSESTTKQFDILLLKLKYPIWNKNYIIDLNLVDDTTIPSKGDTLTTTTSSSSSSSSVVMVDYIPNWKCQQYSDYYDTRIKKNAICTTASTTSAVSATTTTTNNNNNHNEAEAVVAPTCENNLKGSPLVLQTSNGKEVQVGIASWSDGKGCDVPRVYTRISSFKKWITNQGCKLSNKKPDFCSSTFTPGTNEVVTYRPGDLTVQENGLSLSTGLTSRIIARSDQKVNYDINNGKSTEVFHRRPDGGAVFQDLETQGKGWVYVSNSERTPGGVGAIQFNGKGKVIGYTKLTSDTSQNCGGGKTYWNTWLTCEERTGGQVWEIDPFGKVPPRQTILGGQGGGRYESAAYDHRKKWKPTFYITTDEIAGPLIRFTPDPKAVQIAITTNDYSNLLHTTSSDENFIHYEYFYITSIDEMTGLGTFIWTSNLSDGRDSAVQYFVQGEGIDIRDGILYFTTKADKLLWIIDLDAGTFQRTSTVSGAFESQPDQVARVLDNKDGSTDDILYFCEDGRDNSGVHGRNKKGKFFTILQDSGNQFNGETTGLSFSPNGMFMYVSFQDPGIIFEIKRIDGYPFHGQRLDIKYHKQDL